MEIDGKDRICKTFDEKIDHILTSCSIMAKEQYTKKHCSVCAQPHFNIRKEIGQNETKDSGTSMYQNW